MALASVVRCPRSVIAGLILSLIGLVEPAGAQTESPTEPAETKSAEVRTGAEQYKTFYLTSLTEPNEANEIVTDLRNMLPRAHVYYVSSEGAMSMRGTAEELQLAQRVLADMDRTRKVYRVTYSITESDGGKAVGTQHLAMIVATGGKTDVKQGSRVPIVTGSVDDPASGKSKQVQYVDLGLNIEASLEGSADGLRLRSRIEQSNVADEKSGIGAEDPIIRQTRLEGISTLVEGRPVVLGSLDIPGTSRHEEIEVVSELVR
jgi:type II secretory pathway component GspD/PulD (secretin)